MRAFMSDSRLRPSHVYTQDHSERCVEADERRAVAEASRILAESEPILPAAYHVQTTDRFDVINDGTLGGTHALLAESLAAIMPELDRLTWKAYAGLHDKCNATNRECLPAAVVAEVWNHNLAELRRMEGR